MSRFADALIDQSRSCDALGSPFTARILRLLAQRLSPGTPLTDRLFGWPGDLTSRGDSVPLRLAGGLHALALHDPAGQLAQAYPPHDVADAPLWQAVQGALNTQSDVLMDWLDSPPQTNEVRRSAALILAALRVVREYGMALRLSELGASAGLNLNFDRFALKIGAQSFGALDPVLCLTPDWTGPHPTQAKIRITDRRGVDLNPLHGADGAARLRAYLWADQPQRRVLTDAALTCPVPRVDAGSAESWLKSRLADEPQPGVVHLIYHTVAWQYFPTAIQMECRVLIEAAGDKARPEAPLAWFAMEADDTPGGAAMTLRLWPGDITLDLGRVDFHGRWITWTGS